MKNVLFAIILFFISHQSVQGRNTVDYRYTLDCNIEPTTPLEICKDVENAIIKSGLPFGESHFKEKQGLIRFYQHLVPGPKGDMFLLVVFTFHSQGTSIMFHNRGPDKIDSIWYGARAVGDGGPRQALAALLKVLSSDISKQLARIQKA